jgi:8-oxo-dGTP diphosphatase
MEIRIPEKKEMSEPNLPRIGVAAFVVKENKVLLGMRKGAHGAMLWATPGGHLEFGESVIECATRELFEETGLKALSCTLGPWVENVMEQGKKHYLTVFVRIDQFEGEPKLLEPDKCQGWQWFSQNELPEPLFPTIISLIALQKGEIFNFRWR